MFNYICWDTVQIYIRLTKVNKRKQTLRNENKTKKRVQWFASFIFAQKTEQKLEKASFERAYRNKQMYKCLVQYAKIRHYMYGFR